MILKLQIRSVILLVMCLFSVSAFAHSSQDIDVALKIVEALNPEEELCKTAFSGIMISQPYRMIADEVGQAKASRIIREEIKSSAPHYQYRWNMNMATLLLDNFSVLELKSIIKQKSKSPYREKFMNKKDALNKAIVERSLPLLQELSKEALKNAWKKRKL